MPRPKTEQPPQLTEAEKWAALARLTQELHDSAFCFLGKLDVLLEEIQATRPRRAKPARLTLARSGLFDKDPKELTPAAREMQRMPVTFPGVVNIADEVAAKMRKPHGMPADLKAMASEPWPDVDDDAPDLEDNTAGLVLNAKQQKRDARLQNQVETITGGLKSLRKRRQH